MSSRLKPIESPANPLMRLAYWYSRKRVGKVISPLKVIQARLPLDFALWTNKMLRLEKKLPLGLELRLLIRIHVAQLNTCKFCIDMSKAEAMKQFKNKEKFFHLNEFEKSPLFSERERLALRFATAVTHKSVSDNIFEQAKKLFAAQELIAIAWMVTSEHVYNLMNLTFNIDSDGFCPLRENGDN